MNIKRYFSTLYGAARRPDFFAHFVTLSHHFPYFFEMYKRIESFQLENVFEIKGSRGSENSGVSLSTL